MRNRIRTRARSARVAIAVSAPSTARVVLKAGHGLFAIAVVAIIGLAVPAEAGRRRSAHPPSGHLTFVSPQSTPIALSPDSSTLLVANTTSGSVDVIDASSLAVVGSVRVGLEPVSVAFRPDGREAWVANHVSDSISVIDTDPTSATHLEVIETIQRFGPRFETEMDEPVGIAFASNSKAYVALSSRNRIGVVDAALYELTDFLDVPAQDPRAISVAGGRLFVAAFESNNRTQVSFCDQLFGTGGIGEPCSLGILEFAQFATNPNLPGVVKNIVVEPTLPDRDLFVYRTSDDQLVKTTTGLGTLLYGLTAEETGHVWVAGTDARNAVNGAHGAALADLDNEMFDNEVVELDCGGAGPTCAVLRVIDLDPAPPDRERSLATPYGVAVARDGEIVVGTAAGADRLFTLDVSSGTVQGRVSVEAAPRGVALASDGLGKARTAFVLNTLGNSVSVVDVSSPSEPVVVATLSVGEDPTPTRIRRGRIAFNSAMASDSGNFSCASCHPDGNTDQLAWRIDGSCFAIGCDPGDAVRTTMPVRGLRDTLPLHWDGSLGDPFGSGNGAALLSGASCDASVDDGRGPSAPGATDGDCFRDLVDASLAGVMCDQDSGCSVGPAGAPGRLTASERRMLAVFLRRISYPPARSRSLGDVVSPEALSGFRDFATDRGGNRGATSCADAGAGCHAFPLGTSTDSETASGFDAPTMRGLTDRFVQHSLPITASKGALELANVGIDVFGIESAALEPGTEWDATVGFREQTTFGAGFLLLEGFYGVRPPAIFQMIEEASTGHSGALGRQVTLSSSALAPVRSGATEALLADLERADRAGVVNLRGHGLHAGVPVTLSYSADDDEYLVGSIRLSRAEVLAAAEEGALRATLTGTLPTRANEERAQPLLAPSASCEDGSPSLVGSSIPRGQAFRVATRHVEADAVVIVDGEIDYSASIEVGVAPSACFDAQGGAALESEAEIVLGSTEVGLHLLQVRSGNGLLSNELPFCVGSDLDCDLLAHSPSP